MVFFKGSEGNTCPIPLWASYPPLYGLVARSVERLVA